ncbi:ATPase, V1/A1 complex, subunit D [Meira miltonrushii]|uniref:ATPase, V1/A1 complex, subunit D n=1 Tax=Meira miltonrushii TaxID=1280837 RepID=A0A316VIC9_9BASI|nr:ATPase, V1/A1 complex, subunit D [Meira miltonrushii]PWN35265.1 ATPase, V1/A1 complex, subunit D [Meira miltonrushii]
MSASGQRESVFPTRQVLNGTKGRLKGAQTGHSLLKRKADALNKRFRTITTKIDEAKRKMGRIMQLAAFSLAEVNYAAGDVGYMVRESVKNATFRVSTKEENVSGVLLPSFEAHAEGGSQEFSLTGLSRGGQQVNKARDTYTKAVKTLVELASLQVSPCLFALLSDNLLTILFSHDRLLSLCWMK